MTELDCAKAELQKETRALELVVEDLRRRVDAGNATLTAMAARSVSGVAQRVLELAAEIKGMEAR